MDEKINGLQAAIGSMAEMTYMFYTAMIGCGASEEVALSCANTFISVTHSAVIKHAWNLGDDKD